MGLQVLNYHQVWLGEEAEGKDEKVKESTQLYSHQQQRGITVINLAMEEKEVW